MTDYGGRIHLVKAAFPFNGQDEDEVQFTVGYYQGLQILLMSGVRVTSASQILEFFWNVWSQVS